MLHAGWLRPYFKPLLNSAKALMVGVFCIGIAGVNPLLGQSSAVTALPGLFTLKLIPVEANPVLVNQFKSLQFKSSQERQVYLQQFIGNLIEQGYLTASVDSTAADSSLLKAWVNIGNRYAWGKLSLGNLKDWPIASGLLNEKSLLKRPLSPLEIKQLFDRIVSYGENHGYPFIGVGLDSVRIENEYLFAELKVQYHQLVKIDSIKIIGSVKIDPKFIYGQIDIQPGGLYNESKLRQISGKIKTVSFLKEKRAARVVFKEKYTQLILELEKKKSSQFDGIIGFLPDPSTGKLNFTGNVQLKLQNVFLGKGEELALQWKSLKGQSQDLLIQPNYPFIWGSRFGVSDEFKLFKQDTTYITINNSLNINYYLTGTSFVQMNYLVKTSNLISTAGLENVTSLPDNADLTAEFYGLGLHLEDLDYKFNPRKGYLIQLKGSVGTKDIHINTAINPVAYAGIGLHSLEYLGEANSSFFVPIVGKNVMKFQVQGAFISGPQLLENEVYRIGGISSLRGFDDLSLHATAYAIGTIEYRYLLEQNSFIHFFFDQASYTDKSLGKAVIDTPFGFGTGISFETKTGIFSLDYALGKQFGNAIDPKMGKIHFGLVSVF